MLGATVLMPILLPCLPVEDPPQWGGFRGPAGSGTVESAPLPEALDPEENLLWRTDIPQGYSSPIVSGEKIFLTGNRGEELLTICLDRGLGEEVWREVIPFDGRRIGANHAAASTPATDGTSLFVVFDPIGLVAYDLDGEELWRRNPGPFAIPHGMATSPVLFEGLVILQVDHDAGSFLVAYDKKDGKELWRTDRSEFTHSYSTPTLYLPEEGRPELIVSGSYRICSYDPSNGELLWWVDGAAFMTKSQPLIQEDVCFVCSYSGAMTEAGLPSITQTFEEALAERDEDEDGKISKTEFDHPMLHRAWFVFDLDDDGFFDERDWAYLLGSSRPTGGLFAIELGGEGDVTESHVLWKYSGRRGIPDFSSPLFFEDTLFMVKSGGLVSTFDPASGDALATERIGEPDTYFASPVCADGKVYLAGRSGLLTVVSAKRDWEILSTTSLEEEVWSTPAIVDGDVLVRSQKALYCFGVE